MEISEAHQPESLVYKVRAWTAPNSTGYNAFAINSEQICIARLEVFDIMDPISDDEVPDFAEEVQVNAAVKIPLKTLIYAKANEKENCVKIAQPKGILKAALGTHGPEITKFKMASPEQCKEFLQALQTFLGDKFIFQRSVWSRLRTLFVLGMVPVVAAIMTWAFHAGAIDLRQGRKIPTGEEPWNTRVALGRKLITPILEFLGPIGVLLVGGLITLACLLWLARKVQDPPIMLTVKKR